MHLLLSGVPRNSERERHFPDEAGKEKLSGTAVLSDVGSCECGWYSEQRY